MVLFYFLKGLERNKPGLAVEKIVFKGKLKKEYFYFRRILVCDVLKLNLKWILIIKFLKELDLKTLFLKIIDLK